MALYIFRRRDTTGSLQGKSKLPSKHIAPLNALLLLVLSNIQHEIDVTIRLLRSNAVGFAFIAMGGILTRVILSPTSMAEAASSTFKAACVGVLCNYVFDIANQASSPLEDYVNKPSRPIPAGLISVNQAIFRWILTWTLGPIMIYSCFGLWAALHLLHFQMLILVCYVWPRWFSWFMRNYFASVSYFILSRLLNQVLVARGPSNQNSSLCIGFAVFIWLMATMHIQEFYDVEGDRKSDRKTLPMLLSDKGLKTLRAGTSMFIIAFGSGYCWLEVQRWLETAWWHRYACCNKFYRACLRTEYRRRIRLRWTRLLITFITTHQF
ncbi:hypothetical protein BBK36DRAFT_1186964 [Trichoderma citrinoviride]|uniref:UbiA prenyltransferase n=1 Tax=Trichoderma citrinoviride TaxID=58853 RepID=A0A2T4BJE8_9HYPO|nr:hypothetical protein BBK36DRAFT_1186964 [Trichoderma citrinoviride]PTB69401.1 hypothetical protein BBK36DRAFT_1186964 [Trichoderma citrinoviride]